MKTEMKYTIENLTKMMIDDKAKFVRFINSLTKDIQAETSSDSLINLKHELFQESRKVEISFQVDSKDTEVVHCMLLNLYQAKEN